jgi:hypothetical protein
MFSKLEHFMALLPPNLKRLTVNWLYIRSGDAKVTQAIDMENDQVPARKPRQLECTILVVLITGFLESSQTLTY